MIDMTIFDMWKAEARAKRKEGLTNQELLDAMEANIDEVIEYLYDLEGKTNVYDTELRKEIRTKKQKCMECMNLVDMLRHRGV